MCKPKVQLLSLLEELGSEDMMTFKWYLGQKHRDGSQSIPRFRLENADRMDIVDQLVINYGIDGAVDTTTNVLLHINRNDLAIRLTQVNVQKRQKSPKVHGDQITQDLSCPICDEIFTEPVALCCGHTFCQTCLHDCWKRKFVQKCPQCPKVIHKVPEINLALNSLSENYRKRRQLDPSGGNKDDVQSETVSSIHAVVKNFQPSCNAHGSIVVNPTIIGSRTGNISISIISGQGRYTVHKTSKNKRSSRGNKSRRKAQCPAALGESDVPTPLNDF